MFELLAGQQIPTTLAGASPSPDTVSQAIKAQAKRLGFDLCGICQAVAPPGVERLQTWLEAGYAGEMHYLPDRSEAASDPRYVLDGARSIVMLAMNYRTVEPVSAGPGQGKVSRYAWGSDYHDLIRDCLAKLADSLRTLVPAAKIRGVVDTAPLLERRIRPIGRIRLGRQKHSAVEQTNGKLVLFGGIADRPGAGIRLAA